tara:strand:- start:80 stop:397 length:318 start_codon:yes stop_codon:yes gene_type:complete
MDWKRFYLWIETHKQATFIVHLLQDGYKKQAEFFRDVIDAYIEEDPEFAKWMDKKRLQKGNANTKKGLARKEKLIKRAEQLQDILFSEQDLSKIFDLIEEENEDF